MSAAQARDLLVDLAGVTLTGRLSVPERARGLVLVAQHEPLPPEHVLAAALGAAGLATLVLALLTEEEQRIDALTHRLRADVRQAARRVVAATDSIVAQPDTAGLPLGYFAAGHAAAAAFLAAAERPAHVRAVVSRAGRPDLVPEALPRVQAPTLLLVGPATRGWPRSTRPTRRSCREWRCTSSPVRPTALAPRHARLRPAGSSTTSRRSRLPRQRRPTARWRRP